MSCKGYDNGIDMPVPFDNRFKLYFFPLPMNHRFIVVLVCVCVCVREREREREHVCVSSWFLLPRVCPPSDLVTVPDGVMRHKQTTH